MMILWESQMAKYLSGHVKYYVLVIDTWGYKERSAYLGCLIVHVTDQGQEHCLVLQGPGQ